MLPGTLLVIQIDAAINGGNSGGPAFDASDRVVGVAFQGIGSAQNIGYLIPASLARMYLAATHEGLNQFRLVDVPFRAQRLENKGLRRFLKVPDGTSGAVVVAVSPLSALAPSENVSNASVLLINDVITAIDGHAVGDDLSTALRPGERVQVDCLITHKSAGETTEMHILRDGLPLTLRAKLDPLPPLLPRWHSFDCLPEWVVIGGLVFVPLTAPLLEDAYRAKSESGQPASALTTLTQAYGTHGFRSDPEREIVVLIDVLSGDDVNHGYDSYSWEWKELVTFNGEAVESLAGLYAAWQRAASADFLEFGFGEKETAWTKRLILDAALVRESEEQLLALHGIPARASAGVLDAKTHSVAVEAGGANVPV